MRGGDDPFEWTERAALHVAVEKPIERRVALDTGFGKDYEIGVFTFGLFDAAEDAVGVGVEVAVGGVDLADGNAHLFVEDRAPSVSSAQSAVLVEKRVVRYILEANPRRGRIMVVQRS